MGKFVLGIVLGASVMGAVVWATERNLSVVSSPVIHLNSLDDFEIIAPTATMPTAECMYYKDGLWNRLTPESLK